MRLIRGAVFASRAGRDAWRKPPPGWSIKQEGRELLARRGFYARQVERRMTSVQQREASVVV